MRRFPETASRTMRMTTVCASARGSKLSFSKTRSVWCDKSTRGLVRHDLRPAAAADALVIGGITARRIRPVHAEMPKGANTRARIFFQKFQFFSAAGAVQVQDDFPVFSFGAEIHGHDVRRVFAAKGKAQRVAAEERFEHVVRARDRPFRPTHGQTVWNGNLRSPP